MNFTNSRAVSYAILFFFSRFDFGQPIMDVVSPQSHGIGGVLLGMSSPTLREVPNEKSAYPPPQFELLAKIWCQKSEVASNPKIGLFSNEGQLQIILRWIMHRRRKLELRLWKSGFWAGYLSKRLWISSEKCMADFLSLSVKNMNAKRKSKSNGIKSDPHRKPPNTKNRQKKRALFHA